MNDARAETVTVLILLPSTEQALLPFGRWRPILWFPASGADRTGGELGDGRNQFDRLDRFDEMELESVAERGRAIVRPRVSGQCRRRSTAQRLLEFAHGPDEREAIDVGHSDVSDDDIRTYLGQRGQRHHAGRARRHDGARSFENSAQ